MNVVSLFTGVGGFDLGLERAGHRIVAQCEADEKARAVLRRHWPDVPIHEDVSELDGEWCRSNGISITGGIGFSGSNKRVSDPEVGQRLGDTVAARDIHLVCGGFPCQDLSVAGKRAGLAGERSGLFFEAARISDLVLGDGGWVLIENVPGLLSSNGGRDFGIVLATLANLGFDDLAWRVLDSRYFGVPQRRRRVFILARRSRGRRAAEVLLEPESGGGNHQAGREARALAASGTGPSIDRTGATQSLSTRFGNSGADLPDAEAGWLVSDTLRANRATGGRYDKHPPTVSPAVTSKWRKGSGGPAGDECQNLVSSPPDSDRMRTAPGIPGRVDDSVTCAYDPKPDGPRYAQMGNAVTVNVAEWLGHRLREFG
jgi:DNA-cytosine methyltransferase